MYKNKSSKFGKYIKRSGPTYTAVLFMLNGLVSILSVLIKNVPQKIDYIFANELDEISRYFAVAVGILLIYLSTQIYQRKKVAYFAAISALSIGVAVEILSLHQPVSLILYLLLLGLLYISRKSYEVQSDATTWRRSILVGVGQLLLISSFVVLVFYVISQHHFGTHLTTSQTVSVTYKAVLGSETPKIVRFTRQDRALIGVIRLSFVFMLVSSATSVFRPLRFFGNTTQQFIDTASTITKAYSTSVEDFFKLWPKDKHYFFYGDSYLAYGVSGGFALILDGATGNPKRLSRLRALFIAECRRNGWKIGIIHANKKEAAWWARHDFNSIYIGSEAMVHIPTFESHTSNNKHFRYIAGKAAKDNLNVVILTPPLTGKTLDTLRGISESWLQRGKREYGFVMGYFDRYYLAQCSVAVLYCGETPLAYTNLIPTFIPHEYSIDHIRAVSGCPSVTNHFLLLELINHLHKSDGISLNLGLSPLSRLDEQIESTSISILSALKKVAGRYYAFSGIEQFKSKFEPEWEPKYILYDGPSTNGVAVTRALSSLTAYKKHK